jgi:hypothetical protein
VNTLYTIPFSKAAVDKIIDDRGQDKSDIIYTVRTSDRRQHFLYDEFVNFTWEQLEDIMMMDGGAEAARIERKLQKVKTANELAFRPASTNQTHTNTETQTQANIQTPQPIEQVQLELEQPKQEEQPIAIEQPKQEEQADTTTTTTTTTTTKPKPTRAKRKTTPNARRTKTPTQSDADTTNSEELTNTE